jgi:hypothetical protein
MTHDTILQPDPHPRLLGLVLQRDQRLLSLALQLDPLKLESCKFNIIIFIIMNIANIIINKFEKSIISYYLFFCFFNQIFFCLI